MVLYLTVDNESFLYGDPVEATDNRNVARPTDGSWLALSLHTVNLVGVTESKTNVCLTSD